MDLAMRIAALAALVTFTILTIYALVSIKSIVAFFKSAKDSLNSVTRDVSDLKNQVGTVLHDVSDLKSRFTRTLDEFSEIKAKAVVSFDNIDDAVTEIKIISKSLEQQADAVFNLMRPLGDLSMYMYQRVAKPVGSALGIASAVTKGIKVFSHVLAARKAKSEKS